VTAQPASGGSELILSDPSVIEQAADPAQYVLLACERAKTWLTHALDHGDIEQIVELKSQAEAIRVYTAQKQLGKDAELSAAEVVRRAERGIGLAIRKGQEAGEIRKRCENGGRTEYRERHEHLAPEENKVSPKAFVANTSEGVAIYAVTDDVSDEQFESAIEQAKDEGNLSRANVVRKVRNITGPETPAERRAKIAELAGQGYSSPQISERIGILPVTVRRIAREESVEIPADLATSKTRRHDSNRIARETVHALEGLAIGVNLIDPDDLDRREIHDWASSLTSSIRVLNRLVKQMKEMAQ
jgi:hypothetical protein